MLHFGGKRRLAKTNAYGLYRRNDGSGTTQGR